jgi:hypothetical protein
VRREALGPVLRSLRTERTKPDLSSHEDK